MGEWILIGILFLCFGITNRWAYQRDLANVKRWSAEIVHPSDEGTHLLTDDTSRYRSRRL